MVYNIGGTNVSTLSANQVIKAGQWTHVAYRYDGAKTQIFIDGVPSGAAVKASGKLKTNSNPLWIGRFSGGGDERRYEGLLDDLRIYNHPLSNAQITALAR